MTDASDQTPGDPSVEQRCDRAGEALGPEGHCYWFADRVSGWSAARSTCQSRGQGWDLAAINTETEHAWVSSRLSSGAWLGGKNMGESWVWVRNGQTFWRGDDDGEAVDQAFTRWEPNEPSGGTNTGQCVRYTQALGDWFWADLPCARQYAAACELTP